MNPDLVIRDEQGKPFTVRYDEINAMLLNEFLKAHQKGQEQDRKIEQQDATITKLKIAFARQKKEIGGFDLANPKGERGARGEKIFTANRTQ